MSLSGRSVFALNDPLKNVPVSLPLLFNFRCERETFGQWLPWMRLIKQTRSFSAESRYSSRSVKTSNQSREPESVSRRECEDFSEARMRDIRLRFPSTSLAPVTDGQSLLSTLHTQVGASLPGESAPPMVPHGWEKQILSKASLALTLSAFLLLFFFKLTSSPPSDSRGQMATL